jgi:ketosteroid isomerase-like protein
VSEANKQVALKFLHAMSEGDAAGQAECLADDAFTNTMGFAGVSGRRDRATMLATVEAFNEVVPTGFRPEIHRVIAEGDSVMIEWEGNAVLSNGEDYCNQYIPVHLRGWEDQAAQRVFLHRPRRHQDPAAAGREGRGAGARELT